MTEPPDRQLTERAADDLLLLLARAEAPDVASPSPADVVGVLSPYVDVVLPQVSRYAQRHGKSAARHVSAGFSMATDTLMPAATGHLLLSLQLLCWASDRTGMTHAEVVTEMHALMAARAED